MACGTPVLAFRCGSVPEIIDEGVTGRIVDDVEAAVSAMSKLLSLNRRVVGRRFEEHFSVMRMARDYVGAYRSLLQRPIDGHHDPIKVAVPLAVMQPEAMLRPDWRTKPTGRRSRSRSPQNSRRC